jgi:glycerol kinase
MTSKLTLVIDQGTYSTRALAFDSAGHVIATAQQPIALHQISADRIEQDPQEIVSSMRTVVESVLADPAVRERGVAHAGMATQRSSVVAWDKTTGAPLAPLLSWQDRRAAEWLKQFEPREKQIKERTGLPLSPHYGASKLRWLLDNKSQVQQARRFGRLCFGPLASFLIFHLLHDRPLAADHANAGRTQLWNIDSRDWDPMLLEMFGVPGELLPACQPIEDAYGLLQESAIPLTAVNGDQNAAVYSLGLPAPGTAIVNLGTGAFVLLPTGAIRMRHPRLLSGLASSDELFGDYTIEGTVNGAAAAIKWAAETWQITDISARLPGWLEQAQDPPIFLNSIGGLGSPFWQPGPEPTIIGEGEPWQKVVAVAESILFLLQVNLQTMADAGLNIEQIRISGGLANVDALCQRLADLTGKAVYRPVETEATARGAAWLAAGQPSHWPEAETGKQFDPQPNDPLHDRYLHFRSELDSRLS